MSREVFAGSLGLQDAALSFPVRLAVERYLQALQQIDPILAAHAVAGPGNEGTVYVYAVLPTEAERNIALHEAIAETAADIVAETGIVIVLMPAESVATRGSHDAV